MNLINKKTTTILLAGFTALAMTGCGSEGTPSDTGIIPGTVQPVTPQPKDMNEQEAKDAMALNAILYPLVTEISNLEILGISCTSSIQALQGCVDLLPLVAPSRPGNTPLPDMKVTYNCSNDASGGHGTFEYAYDTNSKEYSITFNNCIDDNNKQKLHEELVFRTCVYNSKPKLEAGISDPSRTYKVIYNGSIKCSPYVKSASNYTYRTIGNSTAQTKMDWTYDGTIDLTSKVAINGNMRELAKYGQPTESWDHLILGSDEEWVFGNTSLTLGASMAFDGKYSYIKHPNQSTVNPDPVGYTFYMDFKQLSYVQTPGSLDETATVNGQVSASCQPDIVTYATTTDMTDLNSTRDSNGQRMPSSGDMTSAISGYNPAPAVFDVPGSNAQVMITSSDGVKTYNSWRDIVTGSSCQKIQDILDGIKVPQPPAQTPPTVHDKLVKDNILFEKVASLSFSNNNRTVVGETDGSAVWYYVEPGHGYKKDGLQTVGETYFDFNASKGNPLSNTDVYVKVYLHDPVNNKDHKVSIYSKSGWDALRNDPIKKDWTIKSDWFEFGFSPHFHMFNGNFVLRIGSSTYHGQDNFKIDHFDVHIDTP